MNNLSDPNGTHFMQFSPMGYGIILLVLVAIVLGASTVASYRKLSLKASLSQGLGSLLWASPVIAILAFVAVKVLPNFQLGAANHQTTDLAPSWLETDDARRDVVEVASFPEIGDSVSIDLQETPTSDLPDWTSQRIQRLAAPKGKPEQEVWRITLESGEDWMDWKLTEKEARDSLEQQAAKLVEEDFRRFHPGSSELPAEDVKKRAVRGELVTHRVFDEGPDEFPGYKIYWQVELSPDVRAQLSETWKEEVSTKRAWLLVRILALLSMIAGAFAAYFKLDAKSEGAHRFRLKLAATALMTASALGVLASLPTA